MVKFFDIKIFRYLQNKKLWIVDACFYLPVIIIRRKRNAKIPLYQIIQSIQLIPYQLLGKNKNNYFIYHLSLLQLILPFEFLKFLCNVNYNALDQLCLLCFSKNLCIFSLHRPMRTKTSILLANNRLQTVPSIRLLGLHLDFKLTYEYLEQLS